MGRDPRNRLNDLSGKEWVYALRSVIMTHFPTRGPAALAHHLRRRHPSPKPPQLMAELVRFFTRADGHVLDPFAGVGGPLLACALEGRSAVGIDLSSRYADCYAEVCRELALPTFPFVVGDARHLLAFPVVRERPFDLILTDPPYAQMLSKEKTGQRKKRGQRAATPFTHSPDDLGEGSPANPRTSYYAPRRCDGTPPPTSLARISWVSHLV